MTRTNPSDTLLQVLARRALAQQGGGCGPQLQGLRWFNARWFRMREDLIYCHHPSCHIPAYHRHPQSHGCFPPHSCSTKVQGRETVSPWETQPVTAVCAGRGSPAPHSSKATHTSISSTSVLARQPHPEIWRGMGQAESQEC